MGYYIDQIDQKFLIKHENFQALKSAYYGTAHLREHFDKYRRTCELDDIKDIVNDIFEYERFDVCFNDSGDIDEISFAGEKYSDIDTFFNAIAKFIDRGSYIDFIGEDYHAFRFYFTGDRMIEINGEIVFHEYNDPIDSINNVSNICQEEIADNPEEFFGIIKGVSSIDLDAYGSVV